MTNLTGLTNSQFFLLVYSLILTKWLKFSHTFTYLKLKQLGKSCTTERVKDDDDVSYIIIIYSTIQHLYDYYACSHQELFPQTSNLKKVKILGKSWRDHSWILKSGQDVVNGG